MDKKGMYLKYFVVEPHKDDPCGHASRKAVLAYSEAIYGWNQNLACDLKSWIDAIERDIVKRDERESLEGTMEEIKPPRPPSF